jgi:AcrR family transcriptional regulator
MARVRDFDRTRTLLISAASELFATQGYDRTSVDRIIKQAGVSKGAFYHHFSSKEEILDAVTAFMVADAMNEIRAAAADVSSGATVRLNRFLNASRIWRLAHFGLLREVIVVLHRDENTPMLRKIEALSTSLSAPLLAEILQQGIDEGVFDPPNPLETARLILQLSGAMRETQLRMLLETGMSEEALSPLQEQADLFVEMVERMLGAAKGSIERLQLLEAFRSTELGLAGEVTTATAGAS